jgi:hypothetical protein
MPSVDTNPINLRNYKCVPLDLLKNTNAQNQVQFNVTGNDVSLQDLKEEKNNTIILSGPSGNAFSPDQIENYFILPLVSLVIILFIIGFFFCGYKIATVAAINQRFIYIGLLITLGFIVGLLITYAALKKSI